MNNVDLSTQIAGVALDSYIMNASGPKCTNLEELTVIGESNSAAIMTKSCTIAPREGNPLPRYQDLPLGSIQSMGLPNLGYKAYLEMIPALKQHGKPVVVSISGFSVEDNIEMVSAFQQSDVDLIEVNFSCPNIVGKAQVAYDFEQTEKSLAAITALGDKPIGIKLAPYFDMSHFIAMANILKRYPVKFITCINSIGNTLVIDPITEQPIIKPKGGFGGLCGEYIKPIGLANVRAFRQLLDDDIQIIGVGGISNGVDAFEYLLAGADAVQVATCFEKQGPNCFQRIEAELALFMANKGYDCLADAKGRLKPL
ncbi:dihydroorotate oxidase [Shewanella intestini]|uniref:Dihydroorotate dehydrogenase n=1 Tax=Shewanella intestini TaxID=2017544 RepID=A0ABS5HZ17_9GAMM|nr:MULTISPECIES: dihydroorotate oxidase [Shewanella]MBR9727037.1 dihydroorotate oxidase [Shewanella intestini]MRG35838.1 dihydroorotate oxidase [Shewanella sp. XMDDZSB0408]